LVLWYGARQVLADRLQAGALLVFLSYLTRLYKPMRELSKQSEVLSRAGAGLERILNLLRTEREVRDLPGAKVAPDFRGRIEFKNVSFAYRAGEPVLHNISFTVEPGRTVALVGSTGSGKTTLTSLVPRFQDADEGQVLIDGRDVRRYTLASLRGQIGMVLQDTVLFYGTVHDNIAYGRPEATFDEIVAAAKAANAHEFIERLPDGYGTLVGERGVNLSGGQRQRLAIARTILRNSPIILLDEPTAGLDASSEAVVLEGLNRLIEGRTALIIAHRLATIRYATSILVLERGQIVERGTHEDLLQKGGRYSELYRLQVHGRASVV
ncbi:MAG TPA: ABC transporter ATP-binding protein, partial [Bryobacteraceae bacterium]|nr:ABC transporter ATP-binding protein [Bryobacteraceae bacterium]